MRPLWTSNLNFSPKILTFPTKIKWPHPLLGIQDDKQWKPGYYSLKTYQKRKVVWDIFLFFFYASWILCILSEKKTLMHFIRKVNIDSNPGLDPSPHLPVFSPIHPGSSNFITKQKKHLELPNNSTIAYLANILFQISLNGSIWSTVSVTVSSKSYFVLTLCSQPNSCQIAW